MSFLAQVIKWLEITFVWYPCKEIIHIKSPHLSKAGFHEKSCVGIKEWRREMFHSPANVVMLVISWLKGESMTDALFSLNMCDCETNVHMRCQANITINISLWISSLSWSVRGGAAHYNGIKCIYAVENGLWGGVANRCQLLMYLLPGRKRLAQLSKWLVWKWLA